MKFRILITATVSILFTLPLSGCWGKVQLEQQGFVVAIGLDKNEDNLIDVTFQMANPQVGTSDIAEAPNEPSSDIVTFTAPDIVSAKELANVVVARKISFDHLLVIIVGEELAKTELFHHVIASSLVSPEMRLANNIIITKEKAGTFIRENKPKLETRPHKYYSFIIKEWKDAGYVPISDLNSYFQQQEGQLFLSAYATTEKQEELRKNEADYLAGQVPEHGGDPVQMIGSAVFNKGKMIGTLTGAETRTALLLRRKTVANYYAQSFPDPIQDDYRIAVQIMKQGRNKVKMNVKSDIPKVKVMIPVKLQIFSNPSLENYSTNLSNQNKLKKSIKESLENDARKLIKKTQEEFESEPFEWYLEARRHFWTLDEYKNYNWEEKYKDAEVEVTFDIKIENLGAQDKPE